MSFQERSIDEREAASIVAGLYANSSMVDGTAGVGVATMAAFGGKKRARGNSAATDKKRAKKKRPAAKKPKAKKKEPPMDATGLVFAQPELKPPPFFYYTDHSLEEDDDPLTPITTAGSVPTFPAKMHAILTNPELSDVIGWAPHGRSWRILKPRDFEIRVLPKYFEHSKFSSFVRQANGWGFRRMSHGYDKNAYYQEYFLRAMPWLCKKMRRPKVAEKKAVDPEMEPDFDAISSQFPVPDRPPTREVLVLQKTIELGPKARMPVLWDTGTPPAAPSSPIRAALMPAGEVSSEANNLSALNHTVSCGDLKPAALPTINNGLLKPAGLPAVPALTAQPVAAPAPEVAGQAAANAMISMGNMGNNAHAQNNVQQFSAMLPSNTASNLNQMSNNALPPTAMANSHQISFNNMLPPNTMTHSNQIPFNSMLPPNTMAHSNQISVSSMQPPNTMTTPNQIPVNSMLPPNTMANSIQNNLNAAFNFAVPPVAAPVPTPVAAPVVTSAPGLSSDSNFAAGFMAATAMHSTQIRNMLSSAFAAGMPIPEAASMAMPPAPPPAPAAPTMTQDLGNAFNLLQRAQMGQNNLNFQPYQAEAAYPAAAGAGNQTFPADNSGGQALQRLLQLQAYQAGRREMPQFSFPPG